MGNGKSRSRRATPPLAPVIDADDMETERKREFGRRVQALLVEAGWNQSDLAREATKHLPKTKRRKEFPRDLVNRYARGATIPRPESLRLLCKALSTAVGREVAEKDLMPPEAWAPRVSPQVTMRHVGDGRVALQFSRVVSMKTATKITELLDAETSVQ